MRKSLVYAILLGIASAACVFLRPSWLYFLPFAIGVHCLLIVATARKNDLVTKTRAARTRRAIKGCLLAVLVFAVCMAPWWIRNYAATGRFVATTLQLGASLYDGWRPDADGASDMRFVESFRASESPDSPTYEYDVDTRMKRASLDWARAHPGRVLSLAGVKFVRLWNPRPNEPSFRAVGVQATVFCSTVPLLVFGLIGIVRTLRLGSSFGRMEYVLLWVPALYLSLLHMIFVSSIRYRTPAELGLAVLAALVVVRFSQLIGPFKAKCSPAAAPLG